MWFKLPHSFKGSIRSRIQIAAAQALTQEQCEITTCSDNVSIHSLQLISSLLVCLFVFSHFTTFCSFSQGVVISHNASARVIRSNQSLVLQKVTRNSSGNYSCSAINAEGETVSNQLPLRVKCKCFTHSVRSV